MPSSLLQKRHGNTAEVTFILIDALVTMASLSTPSLLLDTVNATLEDSSFKTGSEVATRAFEAAETLKGWCRDKSNEVPYTEFSEQLLKELKGALPAVATINRERIWRSFFSLRSSSIIGRACALSQTYGVNSNKRLHLFLSSVSHFGRHSEKPSATSLALDPIPCSGMVT